MQTKTAVLLVNLGTPDSLAKKDVFRYLIEFLTDERVIDIPWINRQILVRGLIVPTRFRTSASYYKAIWTPEGSPLKVFGYKLKEKLQTYLGENFIVELAMRYQNPSIDKMLTRLNQSQIKKLIVVPLFPQYASATTGSIHQKVMEIISKWNNIPELILVDQYATHPKLIEAFCHVAKDKEMSSYDHILFSFHGLPESQLIKADSCNHCLKVKDCCKTLSEKNHKCYAANCYATAQAIVKKLAIQKDKYSIAFQSRLGSKPWLQPYTSETIERLAKEGHKKILVFCPAFTSDCLETLYEIGMEYAEEFKSFGGKSLDLVPGLNDDPLFVEAISSIVESYCSYTQHVSKV